MSSFLANCKKSAPDLFSVPTDVEKYNKHPLFPLNELIRIGSFHGIVVNYENRSARDEDICVIYPTNGVVELDVIRMFLVQTPSSETYILPGIPSTSTKIHQVPFSVPTFSSVKEFMIPIARSIQFNRIDDSFLAYFEGFMPYRRLDMTHITECSVNGEIIAFARSGVTVMEEIKIRPGWSLESAGIAGMDNIMEEIITELFIPYIVDRPDIIKPKGLLLYGPPGNGKTLIAKALCTLLDTGVEPVIINGSNLLDKYVGESEKRLREALTPPPSKTKYPHIVIIDEIDAIIGKRSSSSGASASVTNGLVTTFLTILDGMESHKLRPLIVIGATNFKRNIDEAALRAGRMGIHKEIPLPNHEARIEIIKHHLKRYENTLTEQDFSEISSVLDGTSGAELAQLVSQTAVKKLNRQMDVRVTASSLTFNSSAAKASFQVNASDFSAELQSYRHNLKMREKVIYIHRGCDVPHKYKNMPVDFPDVHMILAEIPGHYDTTQFLRILKHIHANESTVITGNSQIMLNHCKDNNYIIFGG